VATIEVKIKLHSNAFGKQGKSDKKEAGICRSAMELCPPYQQRSRWVIGVNR
jgi:hypothetical protein